MPPGFGHHWGVTVFVNFSSPSNLNVFTRPEVIFDASEKTHWWSFFIEKM